jgi:hypothetical protein
MIVEGCGHMGPVQDPTVIAQKIVIPAQAGTQ